MSVRAARSPVSSPRSTIMRSAILSRGERPAGSPQHAKHSPAQGRELLARRVAPLPRLDRSYRVEGMELLDHGIQAGEVRVQLPDARLRLLQLARRLGAALHQGGKHELVHAMVSGTPPHPLRNGLVLLAT
jgi:hypothetical protein